MSSEQLGISLRTPIPKDAIGVIYCLTCDKPLVFRNGQPMNDWVIRRHTADHRMFMGDCQVVEVNITTGRYAII